MKTTVNVFIIIGILLVVLTFSYFSVNPQEKLKESRDETRFTAASELYDSLNRYYSSKALYPWSNPNNTNGCEPVSEARQGLGTTGITTLTSRKPCIETVINTGDLRKDYFSKYAEIVSSIYITDETPLIPTSSKVYICYLPESQKYQKGAQAVYTESGKLERKGCMAHGSKKVCAICVK